MFLIIKGPPVITAKNLISVRAPKSRKISGIKRGNKDCKKTEGGGGGNYRKNEDWKM